MVNRKKRNCQSPQPKQGDVVETKRPEMIPTEVKTSQSKPKRAGFERQFKRQESKQDLVEPLTPPVPDVRRLIEGKDADWQTIAALNRFKEIGKLKDKQKLWLLPLGQFIVDDSWFLTSIRRKWGRQNREEILGKIILDTSLLNLTFDNFHRSDKALIVQTISNAQPGFGVLETVYPDYTKEVQTIMTILKTIR